MTQLTDKERTAKNDGTRKGVVGDGKLAPGGREST